MKTITVILAVLLFVIVYLTACGPEEVKPPPDQVTVQLKWVHQAQFAGFYVAQEKGYYADQNLKVNLIPFSFEEPTMEAVVTGKADFGIKSASEIIQAKAEGLPVQAFAVIYQDSPFVIIH
jgi:NitT/TauT family transport system substrate-binding protein